jgi:hypothetical protein
VVFGFEVRHRDCHHHHANFKSTTLAGIIATSDKKKTACGAGTKTAGPAYHPRTERRLRALPTAPREPMYSVVYWTGLATLLVWTAYSAYSAIIGF